MECNREEAFRAREIAAKKLENKDFAGAKRTALKAERLFPELDNIHQLLTVCEVNCAASAKICGDLDWYGILQVEATADDKVIRKQYDTLASWLHPDKNTLFGAEAALKLVSEAYAILGDHKKRSLYDIKRQYASKQVAEKATEPSSKTPPGFVQVFWTICPHCRKRFMYYKRNLLVLCDDCGKLFFAFKLHEQALPSRWLVDGAKYSLVSPEKFSCQQDGVSNQQTQYTKLCSTEGDRDSGPRLNVVHIDDCINLDGKASGDGNLSEIRSSVVQFSERNQTKCLAPAAEKDTIGSLTSDPANANIITTQDLSREDASPMPVVTDSSSVQILGRRKQDDGADSSNSMNSCQNKKQRKCNSPSSAVSSYVQTSKDDFAGSDSVCAEYPVSTKVNRPEEASVAYEGNEPKCIEEGTDTASQKSCSPVILYNCPDFFDFHKFRDVSQIAVDQIWALYGNLDGMPRYYAQVNHIDNSNLKVQFTRMEHKPRNEQESNWTSKELPVACGNFCLGETHVIRDPSTYLSHRVACTKGKESNFYKIYPNKGEVWALFKGWTMKWMSEVDNDRSYGYDVVQILSNSLMDAGVTVSPLVKIEGFVSLFAQAKDKPSFLVPSSELLRFSHCIPFYSTNGTEKAGIAEGFLELDTAALPSDLDATFPSITLDSYMSLDKKVNTEFIGYAYPCSEFHNFDGGHSCQKFEPGQIWALYSGYDKFPKFYGWISKVELEQFRVHLIWLEVCPEKEQEKLWLEQDIPISCGKFETRNWKTECDDTSAFSHLVENSQIDTNCHIKILPRTGEIWVIYKNWSTDWAPSSSNHTNRCAEYAIGEIVKFTESSILFSFLTKVDGYVAVFKGRWWQAP